MSSWWINLAKKGNGALCKVMVLDDQEILEEMSLAQGNDREPTDALVSSAASRSRITAREVTYEIVQRNERHERHLRTRNDSFLLLLWFTVYDQNDDGGAAII
jgi:hypothetical protein